MKNRLIAVLALIASVVGFAPAQAAELRVVSGASAYAVSYTHLTLPTKRIV